MITKSPRPVERIAKNIPKAWRVTSSCLGYAIAWKHYNTGVHRGDTILWKLPFAAWTQHLSSHHLNSVYILVRSKYIKAKHGTFSGISSQVCWNSSLHAGGKSRSPKLCADPVTTIPLCPSCSCTMIYAVFGVKISRRHFWQSSAPGSTFAISLLASALAQLRAHFAAQVTRPTQAAREWNICLGSSSNFTSHLCHQKQSSVITHWESQKLQAKSLPLQLSLKTDRREIYTI